MVLVQHFLQSLQLEAVVVEHFLTFRLLVEMVVLVVVVVVKITLALAPTLVGQELLVKEIMVALEAEQIQIMLAAEGAVLELAGRLLQLFMLELEVAELPLLLQEHP
jgi:hypothetical protein